MLDELSKQYMFEVSKMFFIVLAAYTWLEVCDNVIKLAFSHAQCSATAVDGRKGYVGQPQPHLLSALQALSSSFHDNQYGHAGRLPRQPCSMIQRVTL